MTIMTRQDALFFTKSQVPFRNNPNETLNATLVFDPGSAVTIISTSFMDSLGYSALTDGVAKSSLDGAIGESKGYLIKVPLTIDFSTGQIRDIQRVAQRREEI